MAKVKYLHAQYNYGLFEPVLSSGIDTVNFAVRILCRQIYFLAILKLLSTGMLQSGTKQSKHY